MDWLQSVAVVIAGLALRLAIPVGFTLILAWWLRRLDARWKLEAEREQARLVELGAVRDPAASSIPVVRNPGCWQIKDCPPERLAGCPAFANTGLPCWQVFRQIDGRLQESCLACAVFRQAPIPSVL